MPRWVEVVATLAALAPSIILHEVSHGWVALAFGDDTAKRARRLTLNPIRHIDPFGTVILPVMLAVIGAPPFGFAKPVPVDVSKLRDPRNHSLLVSLAGPAVNLVLVALASVVVAFRASLPEAVVIGAFLVGTVNVLLAVFNMIPLPPLDGSAVIERLLPVRFLGRWFRFRQYSMGLLILLVFAVPDRWSFGRLVLSPAVDWWYRIVL